MCCRTVAERVGAAPSSFSNSDGRASLSTRAHRDSFDDAKASKGVGRMAREVASKILDGINDLVIMAPIRDGFIPAYEPVTYATRLRVICEALHDVRPTESDYEKVTPFADAYEAILSLTDFKEGAIEQGSLQLEPPHVPPR